MDKPSAFMAVIGAAAASVVFGGAAGPRSPAVHDVPTPAATTPMAAASEVKCASGAKSARPLAAQVTPPTGPSDRQVNASGTRAAGGAGTVPDRPAGDPCTTAAKRQADRRAAEAASDAR
ncbi:MAG TPA: hypothetical protein VF169_27290 [Albitalea sp.]|uniref:hypothetical protein n=1 Tax=Piscinibacter sp. TaxID=1903157 RepID=UPI002ED05B8A